MRQNSIASGVMMDSLEPRTLFAGTPTIPGLPPINLPTPGVTSISIAGSIDTSDKDKSQFAVSKHDGGVLLPTYEDFLRGTLLYSYVRYPTAHENLSHFIAGNKNPVTFTGVDHKTLIAQVDASSEFATIRKRLFTEILSLAHSVTVPATGSHQAKKVLPLKKIDEVAWGGGDLYYAFHGTQGISVNAAMVKFHNGQMGGAVTFNISDVYGFDDMDGTKALLYPAYYVQRHGNAHYFRTTISLVYQYAKNTFKLIVGQTSSGKSVSSVLPTAAVESKLFADQTKIGEMADLLRQ